MLDRIVSLIGRNKKWYLIMTPGFNFLSYDGKTPESSMKNDISYPNKGISTEKIKVTTMSSAPKTNSSPNKVSEMSKPETTTKSTAETTKRNELDVTTKPESSMSKPETTTEAYKPNVTTKQPKMIEPTKSDKQKLRRKPIKNKVSVPPKTTCPSNGYIKDANDYYECEAGKVQQYVYKIICPRKFHYVIECDCCEL